MENRSSIIRFAALKMEIAKAEKELEELESMQSGSGSRYGYATDGSYILNANRSSGADMIHQNPDAQLYFR